MASPPHRNPRSMAAPEAAGKATTFLLILFLSLPIVTPLIEEEDSREILTAQITRLETLVSTLSLTVTALESALSTYSTPIIHGAITAGVSVKKHKPSWPDRFQFAAAAQLDSTVTSATILPYESKFFAIGDTHGKVFIFSSTGDVIIELPIISHAPVTAMLAYLSSRENESFLFTGHSDGTIAAHRVSSVTNGDIGDDSLSLVSSRAFIKGGFEFEFDSPPVTSLEVHHVGRTCYIIATDCGGRIRVFTETGTLYGTAIASARPLVFMKQRLLFLTETGAGSLDIRSMAVKETECEGLNGSIVHSYSFDGLERTKAYGFTSDGDLIHVILFGDVANLKCRVRSIRKSEIESPISIQTIKGYLLVMSMDKVSVYKGAPRPLFSASIQEIKSEFLSSEALGDKLLAGKPLIAVDHEKLVVLGLGGGYVGIYRSNFPVYKAETNAVVWSAPALLFLLFLIGIWQFYVKKKDTLGWTPEEAFSVSGAPSGDRAYADGSRASDTSGSCHRGPLRRFSSPPRYPGGHNTPFRPSSADPSFRATGDLIYRGQNTEPSGLPKVRETMFSNTQFMDELID